MLINLAFGVSFDGSFCQKNDIQPLQILYSQDSFQEIGDPKVINSNGNSDISKLWEDTLLTVFPKQQEIEENQDEDFETALKELYVEPRIDEEVAIFERRMSNLVNSAVTNTNKKGRTKKPTK
jgi:hypothetical protein